MSARGAGRGWVASAIGRRGRYPAPPGMALWWTPAPRSGRLLAWLRPPSTRLAASPCCRATPRVVQGGFRRLLPAPRDLPDGQEPPHPPQEAHVQEGLDPAPDPVVLFGNYMRAVDDLIDQVEDGTVSSREVFRLYTASAVILSHQLSEIFLSRLPRDGMPQMASDVRGSTGLPRD